jgi:penicillin-binding protein 1A
MSLKLYKFFMISLLIIALCGGLFFGYIISEVNQGKELNKLATYLPTTPTKLYDINGIPFAELYRHKQELVKIQDIPPHVLNAFLSVEDTNFYNHFGIDFMAILRAAVVNIVNLKVKQGGSTLTQQLSKAILQDTKKSFTRKFVEALLTLQIEQEYSKDEILEIYFNLIYLGHGTTGISSAANVYFSKDVKDLTIAEGAVLARLPKAPVKYSPYKNPQTAKDAHLTVLRLMADHGYLDRSKIESIHTEFWRTYWPIVITQSPSRSTWGNRLDRAPYFTEEIRKQLQRKFDEEYIYTGGLRVYTTLDIRKQEIAEEELRKALIEQDKISFGTATSYRGGVDRSLFGLYGLLGGIFQLRVPLINRFDFKANYNITLEKELLDPLEILTTLTPVDNEGEAVQELRKRTAVFAKNLHVEGAFITVEHKTGYIQTMVGGSKFTPQNQFNRALYARRQTGSAFKPFVYGASIRNRDIGTGSGIMDAPMMTMADDGQGWAPEDSTGEFRGMVTIKRGLALSMNIVSVQLYFKTGGEAIIDFASKVTGVSKFRFPDNPTLALGVAELTPLEMAKGYGVYANRGREFIPFSLRYVVDQTGTIVYNKEIEVQAEIAKKTKDGSIQLISEGNAYLMRKLLEYVNVGGTPATGLRSPEYANYQGESGGKTGSTSGWKDAWYCGFDPKYTSIVWLGYDKSSVSLGRHAYAAAIAAPIWGRIYRRFYNGKDYPTFKEENNGDPVPSDVRNGGTCMYNGLSPKPGVCPVTGSQYLENITIAGQTKGVSGLRQCDGDRDHLGSINFNDFLKKEFKITEDEVKKKN